MRIVHLSTLDHGGAGVAALRLHLGLLALGADSRMLVLKSLGGAAGVEEVPTRRDDSGMAAWSAQFKRWKGLLRRYPDRPEGLEIFTGVGADALLADHPVLRQADVVNLHWVAGLIDIPSMKALFAGRRLFWTLHDQNPFTGGCHYTDGCRKFEIGCGACPQLGSNRDDDVAGRQWRIKEEAYSGLAPRIVAPSRWLAGEARKSALFRTFQVSVRPYGLPLERFRPWPEAEIRTALGLAGDDIAVLYGAEAHTKRKGAEVTRVLLDLLPERIKGRRVVAVSFGHVAGDRPSRARRVDLGYVRGEEAMARIYAMADVVLVPSIEDNLPNVVLEALACGTPVVGFDVGGIPDMVEHGRNGFLAPRGDVEGLLRGIMWAVAAGRGIRDAIAEDARARFPLTLQAERYLALYREAGAERPVPVKSPGS